MAPQFVILDQSEVILLLLSLLTCCCAVAQDHLRNVRVPEWRTFLHVVLRQAQLVFEDLLELVASRHVLVVLENRISTLFRVSVP